MKEITTALEYLEKFRGATVTPPAGQLLQAVQALDRPARARGLTQIIPAVVQPAVPFHTMIPANYGRRMFMVLSPVANVRICPLIAGITPTAQISFVIPQQSMATWLKEEDFGALVWCEWVTDFQVVGQTLLVLQEVFY